MKLLTLLLNRPALGVACLLVSLTTLNGQTEVKYPADAPVWNVRNYGAVGNGVADDTAAFKAAIDAALNANARYDAIRIIYVPNGIYKITDSLEARTINTATWYGWRAGFFLQGESQPGTILRVPNATTGFTDAAVPRPVLKTGSESAHDAGGGGNQAFRHYIKNLTVDVGQGNPGAVGIDYVCNNRGGIYNVTVKSSDPALVGHTGIRMDRSWPGPAIIKNVTVSGFDNGITLKNHYQYGMTLENITLQNQRAYGIYVKNNSLRVRKLTSTNTVPVIYMETTHSNLVLVDGTFTGGGASNSAIRNWGKFYGRNITSSGYANIIQDNTGNARTIVGGAAPVTVAEYSSHGPHKEFADSINGAIQMPVKETPVFNTTDFSQWANVVTYGATPFNSASDDRAAIQAAIDSGKPIVYLPQGQYHVSDTIIIRGSVQKFIGLCAGLNKTSAFPAGAPLVRFDGGTASATILQYIRFYGDVVHNSTKQLAIVNCDVTASYRNTSIGTGDVFFEDLMGPLPINIDYPQSAYGRQLNLEFASVSFIKNQGGNIWLLGYKTEGKNGSVIENNGGWVELLGGFFYPQDGVPAVPMIVNNNGKFSGVWKLNGSNNYPVHVRDIRGTTTSDFTSGEVPNTNNCALYSGSTQLFPVVVITQAARYDFTNSSLASSDTDPGTVAANFSQGAGYTSVGFNSNSRSVSGPGSSGASAATNNTNGEYFRFTLAPAPGKLLALDNLTFQARRASSSPDRLTVYVIPTGGSATGQTLNVLNNVSISGSFATFTADLSAPELEGISNAEVRFIFHGNNQGVGSDYIDAVQLDAGAF